MFWCWPVPIYIMLIIFAQQDISCSPLWRTTSHLRKCLHQIGPGAPLCGIFLIEHWWRGSSQPTVDFTTALLVVLGKLRKHYQTMGNKTVNNILLEARLRETQREKLSFNMKARRATQSSTGSYLYLCSKWWSCLQESQNDAISERYPPIL